MRRRPRILHTIKASLISIYNEISQPLLLRNLSSHLKAEHVPDLLRGRHLRRPYSPFWWWVISWEGIAQSTLTSDVIVFNDVRSLFPCTFYHPCQWRSFSVSMYILSSMSMTKFLCFHVPFIINVNDVVSLFPCTFYHQCQWSSFSVSLCLFHQCQWSSFSVPMCLFSSMSMT